MWKLIIFSLSLELCILVNFSTSLSIENHDIISKRQIRSVADTTNSTKINATVSPTIRTNITTRKPDLNTIGYEQPETDNQTKILNEIIKQVSDNLPEATQKVNSTLKNIGINDPSVVLKTLSKPNVTLKEIQSTINQTALEKEVKETQELADNDLATLLVQHQAETALKDIKKAMANTPLSGLTNTTTSLIKANLNGTKFNLTKLLDPNYNPAIYLMRLKAPWKHVLEKHSDNETEVVQVCRFEKLTASCSAEYTSWNAKVWFQLSEAPGRNGINITTFTTGYIPKVSFNKLVNGTHCKAVDDSRVHHICVKVYGYDKDVGPTRFCLQIGAAITNHGIASSDYGCFRFVSSVTHENPMDNETPHPNILMSRMLDLNVNIYRNNTGSPLFQANLVMPALTMLTTLLYLRY